MTRPLLRRLLLAACATLLALGAPVLAAAPGQAVGPSWRAVITFEKNQAAPFRSRLVWRLSSRPAGGAWKVVETRSWRAGSGLGGRAGRNSCYRDHGWLPNGTYRLRMYADYPGSIIKGRAFRLDDHACANGTVRTALFIHTEQGAGNVQCADRPGDQACRWEYPKIQDYRSLGCVKVAPGDLAALAAAYTRHFAPGVRYPLDQVAFRVVG